MAPEVSTSISALLASALPKRSVGELSQAHPALAMIAQWKLFMPKEEIADVSGRAGVEALLSLEGYGEKVAYEPDAEVPVRIEEALAGHVQGEGARETRKQPYETQKRPTDMPVTCRWIRQGTGGGVC